MKSKDTALEDTVMDFVGDRTCILFGSCLAKIEPDVHLGLDEVIVVSGSPKYKAISTQYGDLRSCVVARGVQCDLTGPLVH